MNNLTEILNGYVKDKEIVEVSYSGNFEIVGGYDVALTLRGSSFAYTVAKNITLEEAKEKVRKIAEVMRNYA